MHDRKVDDATVFIGAGWYHLGTGCGRIASHCRVQQWLIGTKTGTTTSLFA